MNSTHLPQADLAPSASEDCVRRVWSEPVCRELDVAAVTLSTPTTGPDGPNFS